MYDPFNIKDDCIYFITYNLPVPNTVPLYFHKSGENVFPSFDSHPPSNHEGWTQTQISPVFVMTEKTVGNIFGINNALQPVPRSDLKFKCINGRCLPWTKDILDIYDSNPQEPLLNLEDCVVHCNELVVSTETIGRPSQLLEIISEQNVRKPVVSRFIQKLPPPVIGILVFLFIMLFFMVFYIIVKKKNGNGRRYR